MGKTFDDISGEALSWIEPAFDTVFEKDLLDDELVKASLYSLKAGGKRIRPVIMYHMGNMLGMDLNELLPFALSLEMIHTYSLIHDDLPSMDNDDLRRGNPTCHKVYGEGMAVLAGDMLLNRAFEIMLGKVVGTPEYSYAAFKMAQYAGIRGMVGGQGIDKMSEGKQLSCDELKILQDKKTGALLKAAFLTPYYMMYGQQEDQIFDTICELSEHAGLAFQIKDDLLDVRSTEEELGKTTGKDERDHKSTFVTALGEEGAASRLQDEMDSCRGCIEILDSLGFDTEAINAIIGFLEERNY